MEEQAMNWKRTSPPMALAVVFAVALASSACATPHHASKQKTDQADLDARPSQPRNYSLVHPGQLDFGLLHKGQKSMYSSALDDF
jgi:hypothetical protein